MAVRDMTGWIYLRDDGTTAYQRRVATYLATQLTVGSNPLIGGRQKATDGSDDGVPEFPHAPNYRPRKVRVRGANGRTYYVPAMSTAAPICTPGTAITMHDGNGASVASLSQEVIPERFPLRVMAHDAP